MPKRGKFIVVDGGEGAGTTTLVRFLAKHFDAVATREPGGTPYAEKLRSLLLHDGDARDLDPFSQFSGMWSARGDHMVRVIVPMLKDGRLVIADRFESSTWAYQIYGAERYDLILLFFATREKCLGQYVPDLYLFLDGDPCRCLERIEGREEEQTHFDEKEIEFHNRVRKGYLHFPRFPDSALHIIDAHQSLLAVQLQALKIIEHELGLT